MMKKIGLLILVFSAGKLFAQESMPMKFNQSGLAIHVGTGLLYGGVGPVVEYQFKYKEKWRFTPLLGTGISIGGPPDQTDTVHSEGIWVNSALGVNVEYGNKNRFFVGPQLISANYRSEILPTSPDKRFFLGFSMMAGYKRTMSNGFLVQGYLGLARIQPPLMTGKNPWMEPHVGAGLGYKF